LATYIIGLYHPQNRVKLAAARPHHGEDLYSQLLINASALSDARFREAVKLCAASAGGGFVLTHLPLKWIFLVSDYAT
jgi:hypothetical protein